MDDETLEVTEQPQPTELERMVMDTVRLSIELPVDEEIEEIKRITTMEVGPSLDRPVIDHLMDAIMTTEDGLVLFLPEPGERVLIERYASCLKGNPWHDTREFIVVKINDETGDVLLWDPENTQQASTNYMTAPGLGHRFKIPGRLAVQTSNRKRRRSKIERLIEREQGGKDKKPVEKRGRKAGTKNRPREVVAAERAAFLEKRAVKLALRDEKKLREAALNGLASRKTAPLEKMKKKGKK